MIESPLKQAHERYGESLREWARGEVASGTITAEASLRVEPEWLPYGDAEAGEAEVCEVLATHGLVEAEYAAIRRGAAIFDRCQRGVIAVRGSDSRDFLNRMITQELKDLKPGMVRRSFWLNRQGRIEADLVVMATDDDAILLDLDRHQAPRTMETLGAFIIVEEVELADVSDEFARLAVHGPRALEAIAAAAGRDDPLLLGPDAASAVEIADVECTIARVDGLGEIGIELFVPREHVERIWSALIETDRTLAEGRRRIRPAGWYAWNIARIEAGTPLMNIDFGTTNLPAETGVIDDRVSFRKGCYLGQEIVARMHSRGASKQRLVGLRVGGDLLPVAGAQVFAADDPKLSQPLGVVTSSTLSPMLGAEPICFAMLRSSAAEDGTAVLVNAEGEQPEARVSPLRFWSKEGAA